MDFQAAGVFGEEVFQYPPVFKESMVDPSDVIVGFAPELVVKRIAAVVVAEFFIGPSYNLFLVRIALIVIGMLSV